jgi:hypothetical protein
VQQHAGGQNWDSFSANPFHGTYMVIHARLCSLFYQVVICGLPKKSANSKGYMQFQAILRRDVIRDNLFKRAMGMSLRRKKHREKDGFATAASTKSALKIYDIGLCPCLRGMVRVI